jgi:hypothetical protein
MIRTAQRTRHGVRIVHNKLLGGWYVVRGPHHAPLAGRFPSKAQAKAWLLAVPIRAALNRKG